MEPVAFELPYTQSLPTTRASKRRVTRNKKPRGRRRSAKPYGVTIPVPQDIAMCCTVSCEYIRTQRRTVNDAAKITLRSCLGVRRGVPTHLKAYAAGSLLLFIDARMINARSCRMFESHPGLDRGSRGEGASAVRCSVRVLQAVVLCQASANHWTASRSLKSEFVICREVSRERGVTGGRVTKSCMAVVLRP